MNPPKPSVTTTPATLISDQRIRVPEMEIPEIQEEPSSNSVWEWGNLLDFAIDDDHQLDIPWSPVVELPPEIGGTTTTTTTEESVEGSDQRVRKRDPRLICENFLAGRVPCACPELDEKYDDEEVIGVGKKKARTAPATAVGSVRCQVPGCEADITKLKGYHRRHRVCLQCATASSVILDGQAKRYCQQCGKFHILPDFDEGKRSCRRKLERHNKRRRRKPTDFRSATDKETPAEHSPEETTCDEVGKDSLCLSNHTVDEGVLESEDGHASPISLLPSSQNIQSDMSFAASGGARVVRKDNVRYAVSSRLCDNKSSYSSVCPTGRISFKLYDWNPAEFPRRLRHQIFQWLASMPVELEGYIRPGCTILTVFITMPPFVWRKLQEDAASYIMDFINAPECLLFGRGPILVYLNDMIFRVLKGGISLMNVNMKGRTPSLHYVHPNCFEAGKPMEFVACGSNLLQPKFRFLVSFSGRYLAYDHCVAISHGKSGLCHASKEDKEYGCGHQIYKICIRNTEQKLFGPAFVEVENESGLSNFIPVLIGDRQTCDEMQMVQQSFDPSLCSRYSQHAVLDVKQVSCEELVLRQTSTSELLLDIAWLLKEPKLEDMQNILYSSQIQRLNCVLNFLIRNECNVLLEKILHYSKFMMNAEKVHDHVTGINDDMKLFEKLLDHARKIVHQGHQHAGGLLLHSETPVLKMDHFSHEYSEKDTLYVVPSSNRDRDISREEQFGSELSSSSQQNSEAIPLLNEQVVMNVNYRSSPRPHPLKVWPPKSCSRIFSITKSHPLVVMLVVSAVCLGMCAVLFHPHKVGEFAVSVRRCLLELDVWLKPTRKWTRDQNTS